MTKKFTFRRNQTIGAANAELDIQFLHQCFVDTGDLQVLQDCEHARRIVVGRTGAGKSALLQRLAECEEQVIPIKPESLALTYISNSTILRFLADVGVKMDIFYRLLWRHIFCVEVLKARFHIDTEESKRSFLDILWRIIPEKKQHKMALDYLKKWGESFWEETEYRIREVTSKLEQELEASLQGSLPPFASAGVGGRMKLTDEQKTEVISRAQTVVNAVQIRELSNVIDLLRDVLLYDRKQKYYITIDELDKDWVDDNLRYRLVRALVETSVDFATIPNMKIVVALRVDLLERVYRLTRDAGFQEEKYEAAMLNLQWTKHQLVQVLDTRIDKLIRSQYTKEPATHKSVLPSKIGRQPAVEYVLDRTLMRPRDVIQFFNSCIAHADGKATITVATLREAEGTYSKGRLRALADEWYALYPNIHHISQVLRNRPSVFPVGDLPLKDLQENILELAGAEKGEPGLDLEMMKDVLEGNMTLDEYRIRVVLVYYKLGLVGLKLSTTSPMSYSYISGVTISRAEVDETTRVEVTKAFWRVLGIGSDASEPA